MCFNTIPVFADTTNSEVIEYQEIEDGFGFAPIPYANELVKPNKAFVGGYVTYLAYLDACGIKEHAPPLTYTKNGVTYYLLNINFGTTNTQAFYYSENDLDKLSDGLTITEDDNYIRPSFGSDVSYMYYNTYSNKGSWYGPYEKNTNTIYKNNVYFNTDFPNLDLVKKVCAFYGDETPDASNPSTGYIPRLPTNKEEYLTHKGNSDIIGPDGKYYSWFFDYRGTNGIVYRLYSDYPLMIVRTKDGVLQKKEHWYFVGRNQNALALNTKTKEFEVALKDDFIYGFSWPTDPDKTGLHGEGPNISELLGGNYNPMFGDLEGNDIVGAPDSEYQDKNDDAPMWGTDTPQEDINTNIENNGGYVENNKDKFTQGIEDANNNFLGISADGLLSFVNSFADFIPFLAVVFSFLPEPIIGLMTVLFMLQAIFVVYRIVRG